MSVKYPAILGLLFLCYANAVSQPAESAGKQEKVNFSSSETWILGYFRPDRFTQKPHSEWYYQGYDSYKFDDEVIARLLAINRDDITIKVVMGSWCPDSRREIPRFMRIMTAINFPVEKIEFLGVDNSKFSPVAGYEEINIERVPTFIFYVKNVEAGRIIENPVTSLEQDMLDILERKQ